MRCSQLFNEARGVSRLWLPPLLDSVADLVPGLCDADGCSVFLVWNDRLHLAATTRQNLKPRVFEHETSYTIDEARLSAAADNFKETGAIVRDAGLTGWVAAFDKPLNLRDITSLQERTALAKEYGLPLPVWSDRLRGHFDWEGNRPFLAVPLRDSSGKVRGVVRAYAVRQSAVPFAPEYVDRLIGFGTAIADFLVDHELLDAGLDEYFRLWTAQDGKALARRLTEAIPRLFRVDCCSFFERDAANRFVLRHAAAGPDIEKPDRRHFDDFRSANLDRLYYDDKLQSKTGLCIKRQAPLLLLHKKPGLWEVVANTAAGTAAKRETLPQESHPQYVGEPHDRTSCELDPRRSRSILLVPVRDTINPRMLAGVLRVVSTEAQPAAEAVLTELRQFAAPLAERLGRTVRQEVEREACQRLIDNLRGFQGENTDANWHKAAEIAAEALDADAVTIFLEQGGLLRAKSTYTYLNEEQIRRDQPRERLEAVQLHHRTFAQIVPNLEYALTDGCTGWAARHKRVLNIRDILDEAELKLSGISHRFTPASSAEITEPGPFIAAPILLNPGAAIEGVVRATRWRRSPQGPFSVSHELILSTFATMLAGVSRAWQPAPQPVDLAVVISYSEAYLKDELCRFLVAIGVRPLDLSGVPAAPSPTLAFRQLMMQAAGGLVVARGDHKGSLSNNVECEIGQLRAYFHEHFPETWKDRLLILTEEGTKLSAMAQDVPHEPFPREKGISLTFTRVATTIRALAGFPLRPAV